MNVVAAVILVVAAIAALTTGTQLSEDEESSLLQALKSLDPYFNQRSVEVYKSLQEGSTVGPDQRERSIGVYKNKRAGISVGPYAEKKSIGVYTNKRGDTPNGAPLQTSIGVYLNDKKPSPHVREVTALSRPQTPDQHVLQRLLRLPDQQDNLHDTDSDDSSEKVLKQIHQLMVKEQTRRLLASLKQQLEDMDNEASESVVSDRRAIVPPQDTKYFSKR